MNNKPTIGILGAGITGLSDAWVLKKQGIDVTVYEKQNYPGGKVKTFQGNGWLVEEGPNTMLVKNKKIWNFLDALELSDRVVKPGPEAKKRYIVRGGELVSVPMSITGLLKTKLLSAKAKLCLLQEPFIKPTQKNDESIAGFIKRRLGSEPLEYAIDPFVSGVYAGDPEKLSIRHTLSSLFDLEQTYGSLTKGLLKREKTEAVSEKALISFDGGLQVLPKTMAEKLSPALHLNTEVVQITQISNGWKVILDKNGEKITRKHPALISTLPLHQLNSIATDGPLNNQVAQLQSIDYAPISVVALGFQQDQIKHPLDGFGMLIPNKEPYSLLGCLFSSALFSNRAPEDHTLITCFIGGSRNPEVVTESTQALIAEVMPQLHQLLGINGMPDFQHHLTWKRAIPQYNVGYQQYLDTMKEIESHHPGLFLAGNFRDGVSVPDCIIHGFETAEKVNVF